VIKLATTTQASRPTPSTDPLFMVIPLVEVEASR
jgi:hypothetical protein